MLTVLSLPGGRARFLLIKSIQSKGRLPSSELFRASGNSFIYSKNDLCEESNQKGVLGEHSLLVLLLHYVYQLEISNENLTCSRFHGFTLLKICSICRILARRQDNERIGR